MLPRDQALDDIDGSPTRFASGEPPEPPCPCCGHVRSVRPLAEIAIPQRRDAYGKVFDIFRPDMVRPTTYMPMPTVENGLAVHGYAVHYAPERRTFARTLHPPRRPWTMGQTIDRRFTIVIDLAFLGLTLFLIGQLIRAVELLDLAVLLGALAILLALWFVVALATGQFRRANGKAQDRYERAARRWRALRYCEDCGHAFRAGGRGYLAPQAVPAYLERDGPDTIPVSNSSDTR